jgi:hypothetical protein
MSESTDSKRQLAEMIKEKLFEGVFLTVLGLFFAPFLILAAQLLFYLKDGVWPNWVLFDVIYSALPAPFIQWLTSPQDWYGLHKIVAWILLESPIALDMLGLSLICTWSAIKFSQN